MKRQNEAKAVKPVSAKRQVKFECSEEFYQRMMDEKLQRNLTIQQLAIRALERYFAAPEYLHRAIEDQAHTTSFPVEDIFRTALEDSVSRHHKMVQKVVPKLYPTLEDLKQSYARMRQQPLVPLADSAADAAAREVFALWSAIFSYVFQFPAEKVRLIRESLALDLKYYRSARIKADSDKAQGED